MIVQIEISNDASCYAFQEFLDKLHKLVVSDDVRPIVKNIEVNPVRLVK